MVRRLLWTYLWPIRAYIRYAPISKGKDFFARRLLRPVLPPLPATFITKLPGNTSIELYYRETLGLSTLLHGVFEEAELRFMQSILSPGVIVWDIGANVGVFSVVMGSAVKKEGQVLAFEPVAQSIERLLSNVRRNALENVEVLQVVLSDKEGEVDLRLADDPAYSSIVGVREGQWSGELLRVPARRLDAIWRERGRPDIAAIKIDVEGAEARVLTGGLECIRACRPVIVAEAKESADLRVLQDILSPFGFESLKPRGFQPWNFVFKVRNLK